MTTRSSVSASVGAVCAAMLADSLLYSVIVPVLPRYASELGASPLAIGALFASYAVTLLAVTPLLGAIADRRGRRKPLILGMVGVAAATLLFALATTYWQLLVARSLQGAAAAAVWTSGVALVADRVPARRLGFTMGLVMASMSAGLILGPPVGGMLAQTFGYPVSFLFSAAVASACALIQVLFAHDAPDRPAANPSRSRPLLADGHLRRVLTTVMIGAAALSMLEPLLPLDLASRLGLGTASIGIIFGAAALAHLLASPIIGTIADRHPPALLMPLGLLGMGAVMPFLAVPDGIVGVAALLVAFAVAYSLVLVPALPDIAAAVRARDHLGYAAAYGAFNMAYAVGMVAGPVAGSAAASLWSLQPVLLCSGALLVLAGSVLVLRAVTARMPQLRLQTGTWPNSSCSSPISVCPRHGTERRNS